MKIISIFNNKGGVGKTTYMYHIAHLLEKQGKNVLVVDLDSQCNLSAYSLSDSELERSWRSDRGNSIWNAIERVYEGLGDIRQRRPSSVSSEYPNLHIVPGDVLLSNYEDSLGDTWSSAKGGNAPALRVQSAIYRYIKWAAEQVNADVVMLDLGPNLGALNRAVLAASDYFIIPMSPDLFSIRGTKNLGAKLSVWRREWDQCNGAANSDIELPQGQPTFLGYVMQQHNIRRNAEGMTRGWSIFGDQVESSVRENIINILDPLGQVHDWGDDNWNLGQIPNLHSLVPYSLEAKKPVFDCTSRDGLNGAHITRARESAQYFDPIVNKLMTVL
ncbi:cobyrinic acid a,c-diamide synthase [Shewanella algae]|uniref:ParA family protein n=1 Tax=Shewanella algae TaxID=38313 RepID=UPI000E335331|nr:AAA family ATPase [Shewanella algae]AXQ16110.1 cobyrinic acid a,c-diamide synthase [Shewanella algae]QXP19050.1 AAA family ATPase [Shewanella algae]QXP28630.1 AAA family ATPase [Shewanella algae]QXP34362.1 AAA family ATPase [Shewanella algae]QXP37816.1 AAA family ATPase [Shewanella algae]